MKKFFESLIAKIGLATITLQIIVMGVFGAYYINRFSQEVEKRIEAQVQIPGNLMNNGLLSYEAVAQRDVMADIISDNIVDAMVVGFNKTVFHSMNFSDVGKNIEDIPRVNKKLFEGDPNDQIIAQEQDANGSYFVSITPIYSVVGKAPFLFAYIKVGTGELETQKTKLRLLFFLGSLLTAIATSVAAIGAFQFVVLSGIKKLTKASHSISDGHLDESVVKELPTQSNDEIGELSRSFAQMTVDLKKSRSAIEEYSKGLEQIVAKRTEELEKSKQELTSKVGELERLNKTMVGRELKMLELKNHIRDLESSPATESPSEPSGSNTPNQ